jgi:hypothetical protein
VIIPFLIENTDRFVPKSFDSAVNAPTVPAFGTVGAFETVFAPIVPLSRTVGALEGAGEF